MTKSYYTGYEEGYKDALRDAERRAQSGHGRRYEAALFGAVRFEGREKEINEQETYEAALREIEKLFHARFGTADGARLENLVCLVESYEEVAFPISAPQLAAAQGDLE